MPRINYRLSRRGLLKGAAGAAASAGASLLGPAMASAAGTAPSTAVQSYVVPSSTGVDLTSLLTVGDNIGGYRMVGIPDGIGIIPNGSTFTVLVNHEIITPLGAVRAHGSVGAFVSRWTVERTGLKVTEGRDLTPSPNSVFLYNPVTGQHAPGTTIWERLCSADLPAVGALRFGNLGTSDRILLNGEEVTNGRAWARIATGANAGEAWQLPRMGHISFENVVASPAPREKTIIMMMDDGALPTSPPVASQNPCEVFMYVGLKRETGHPIERAGLTDGRLMGLRILRGDAIVEQESNDYGLGNAASGMVTSARFEFREMGSNGDVSALSALAMEEEAIGKKITQWMRPEDGAWDPRPARANDFYFVTTASLTLNSRLWRLRFDDMDHPESGGIIDMMLKGNEGHHMLDNITIDRHGRLLVQEDAGAAPYISKVWVYGLDTGEFIEVAKHNPDLFDPAVATSNFITMDEESSGIIDAEDALGPGWFLMAVQVHKPNPDPELVEGGQLLALFVHPNIGTGGGRASA